MTDISGQFPADFVWGAATASYQIEGAADEDGRGESIWDRFSRTPGKVENGDTGDVACDHYHRWQDDVALMRELNLNAYRFSIAWPRVIPAGTGPVNQAGLDFYDRLVDGLLEAGITPWATLYHWDLPQSLEDAGGWPAMATAEAFVPYVEAVTRRLGDRVKHWITLNEPWVSSMLGYLLGIHAPGRTDLGDALATSHQLLRAHGLAVPVIRTNSPESQVGITLNLTSAYPANPGNQGHVDAARSFDGFMNRWFLDPLAGRGYPDDMLKVYGDAAPEISEADLSAIAVPTDFLGVNYYTPSYLRAGDKGPMPFTPVDRPGDRTAMGWLVEPKGLEDLLVRLDHDYPAKPLYITENGAAYDDPEPANGSVSDPERLRYLAGHLAAAKRAIDAGADLRGYFAWSLLDNFEWSFGYTKRFGIVHVDYDTQTRTIKESGRWYANVAEEHRQSGADD